MSPRVHVREASVWTIGAAVALAAHGAGLAALIAGGHGAVTAAGPIPIIVEVGPQSAMMSELLDVAPGVRQQQAEARLNESAQPFDAPVAQEADLSRRQDARQSEEAPPTDQVAALDTTAPPTIEANAASMRVATATYEQILLAHLERNKRYPRAARAHRQQGIATVRFTMNRQGRVLSARLVRSAGHDLLDEEVMALLERAQPLPPPPHEMPGSTIDLTVPVEFYLR